MGTNLDFNPVTGVLDLINDLNDKGWFATELALNTAYPTGQDGWFATVGETDTIWVWDGNTSAWVDSGIKPTEYTAGDGLALVGKEFYNTDKGSDVEKVKVTALNNTGVLLTKGKIVKINGLDTTNITIELVDNTTEADVNMTLGILNDSIPDGDTGEILLKGKYVGNTDLYLSDKFDVSTAVYNQNFSVAGQDTTPAGIAFNTDGTKMFIVGSVGRKVNEYNLSTSFDVSTAVYSQNFSVSSQEIQPYGIAFNTDGTKMFVIGFVGRKVNEYNLSTSFDVSTAVYSQNFSVSSQESQPTGIVFNTDGTKMFVIGINGKNVNEYNLSTGFNVSTAVYSQNFSVASKESSPYGIVFNTDGTKMFVVGNAGDNVNEYNLSTSFDVSTAVYNQNFSVAGQDDNPAGITFNTDGTKMFIVGNTGDDVNEYNLGTAFIGPVYLDEVAGNLTTAKPEPPLNIVYFGDCLKNGFVDGVIMVNPRVVCGDREITKEPTGFANPGSVIVTENGDRTITLTGDTEAYLKGVYCNDLIDGYTSSAHGTDTSKVYILTKNGTDIDWRDISVYTDFFKDVLIALAFYDTTNTTWVYRPETHGLMQRQTHKELHETIGAYRTSGGDITNYTKSSTIATDRRPDISATIINDEDLPNTLNTLTTKSYTLGRNTGTGVFGFDLASTEIVRLTGNNPLYNTFSTPNRGETLMPDNSVATVWLLAIPTALGNSEQYRYVWVQPQWVTQALGAGGPQLASAIAQEEMRSPSELNFTNINNLTPEKVIIERFTIKYTGGNWSIVNNIRISGTQRTQVSAPSGNYLSVVNTDFTLRGDGTASNPLGTISPIYDSTNIPALKAGQRIRYENDIFGGSEEFCVLSNTTAGENPYSAPDKFVKPNNPYRITPLFALYAGTGTGATTYKTEVYTVSGVRYIAIQNVSSTAGGIIIYNLDTKEEITTIALNNCQTICYSQAKNRLYAFLIDGTFRSYNHLGADEKTLQYEASAYGAISESLIINDGASCLIAISGKDASNNMYGYVIPVDSDETVGTIIKSSALAISNHQLLYVQATWDSENNIYTAMLGSGGSNRVIKFVYDSGAGTFTGYIIHLGAGLLGNVSYTGGVIVGDKLYLNGTSQISVQPKDTLVAFVKDSYIYGTSIVNNNLVYLPAFNRILTIRRDMSNGTTNNLIIFSPDDPSDLYLESINANDVVGIDTTRHYVFIYSINSRCIRVYKY